MWIVNNQTIKNNKIVTYWNDKIILMITEIRCPKSASHQSRDIIISVHISSVCDFAHVYSLLIWNEKSPFSMDTRRTRAHVCSMWRLQPIVVHYKTYSIEWVGVTSFSQWFSELKKNVKRIILKMIKNFTTVTVTQYETYL